HVCGRARADACCASLAKSSRADSRIKRGSTPFGFYRIAGIVLPQPSNRTKLGQKPSSGRRKGSMETPLTPLEFMRRTRRLHPQREAVVDGDLRLTYEQFFERCDRWSAALQRL